MKEMVLQKKKKKKKWFSVGEKISRPLYIAEDVS